MNGKLPSLWQELKRRKVLPILVAYLTACVAIIELFSNASETFSISGGSVRLLYLLSAIGVPVVIVFTCYINRNRRPEALKTPEATEALAEAELAAEPDRKSSHNLPAQVTNFIGREKEAVELCSLLENNRLVTITGAGGCGKTRISMKIAEQCLGHYNDGVWFVDLAPVEDPGLIPREVANTLSITEKPGVPILSTLIEEVGQKHCLLLLDNCEHLVDASADLAQQLLRSSPELKVLATSREALKVSGEVLWRVPSLSLPDGDEEASLESIEGSEAIQLFADRARNSKPDFQLDETNSSIILLICQQLDGIPLAIEMAAARIRHMDVKMILERINDRFQLLSSDRRTHTSRQKTLKATLDWSYELLSEKEQILFARLSVFADDFSVENAEELCSGGSLERPEVFDLLTGLVDKSMVVIKTLTEQQVRYGMLETLKDYAACRLAEAGEKEDMDRKHFEFILDLLDQAFPERYNRGFEWAERIQQEHDECLKALGWAEKDPERFLMICGGLGWFWESRAYYELGFLKLKQALKGHRDRSEYTARAQTIYGSLGIVYPEDAADAGALLEDALAIWTELGNKFEAGHLHYTFGTAKAMNNELDAAMSHFREAFTIFESLGDPQLIALGKYGLGFGHVCSFEPDKAEPILEEALPDLIRFDMKREIGLTRHVHADCALLRKDYPESLRRYRIALEACIRAKTQFQAITELLGLAMALAGLGVQKEALMFQGLTLSLYRELGILMDDSIWPEFWTHCINETLGKAKAEVGPERTAQYEQEGIAMGFEQAVELALDPALA